MRQKPATQKKVETYTVVTNYSLSLCNPYKQRVYFASTIEWE